MRPLLLTAILLLLFGSVTACGGDANEICQKIYGECGGALVDDQGGSISQETCIRQLDDLAGEQPERVQRLATCVAETACESLDSCFGS